MVGAGTPYVAPADERPLVASVDVLDLEVAGGVVDERLPRAERSVIALVAGAVGGWLDALHDAAGSDNVLEEGGVPLLERPVEASMTSSVVVVMSPVGLMRFLLDWGRGLISPASVDTVSSKAGQGQSSLG